MCGSSGQMFDFIIYQGSTTELNEEHVGVCGHGAAVEANDLGVPKSIRSRCVKKRGKPSSLLQEEEKPYKLANTEVQPYKEVRLDKIGHLPIMNDNGRQFGTRCKNPGCKGKLRVKCCKCQVHLCLTKTSNCFYIVHSRGVHQQQSDLVAELN
ncbi:hypothetical protein ILUMI_02234 [Ignelater luminosus]|uniref:Uncharacterized protein n=1 Tax=Ignelater luminosus TaxID=2038154 RepID=A0A8K0DGT6_IGNLU|nr:hypothetical protein ILUMI_02234 [Ignelater luminosus]